MEITHLVGEKFSLATTRVTDGLTLKIHSLYTGTSNNYNTTKVNNNEIYTFTSATIYCTALHFM